MNIQHIDQIYMCLPMNGEAEMTCKGRFDACQQKTPLQTAAIVDRTPKPSPGSAPPASRSAASRTSCHHDADVANNILFSRTLVVVENTALRQAAHRAVGARKLDNEPRVSTSALATPRSGANSLEDLHDVDDRGRRDNPKRGHSKNRIRRHRLGIGRTCGAGSTQHHQIALNNARGADSRPNTGSEASAFQIRLWPDAASSGSELGERGGSDAPKTTPSGSGASQTSGCTESQPNWEPCEAESGTRLLADAGTTAKRIPGLQL